MMVTRRQKRNKKDPEAEADGSPQLVNHVDSHILSTIHPSFQASQREDKAAES